MGEEKEGVLEAKTPAGVSEERADPLCFKLRSYFCSQCPGKEETRNCFPGFI